MLMYVGSRRRKERTWEVRPHGGKGDEMPVEGAAGGAMLPKKTTLKMMMKGKVKRIGSLGGGWS